MDTAVHVYYALMEISWALPLALVGNIVLLIREPLLAD